ncbi:PucR family transcriptional regulator [Streptomyces sp. 4N509B]|uniref:PucR family transcriptional regulator n=1 Tax=Streptomyces sp. 4N509B TaxID=3457413 RepID=UPI003FD57A5B
MRLRTLLHTHGLGLRLLTGEDLLDRRLRGVMTTDLRDPRRYLRGGELVLTGLAWWRGPGDAEPFVRLLADAGVCAVAAGEAEFGAVPDDLTRACERHGLPLFAVVEEVSFAEITEHVRRRLSPTRAGELAAVVERHRRLTAASPTGGGPRAVLDLLGTDLGLRAWLLTSTGRPLAASGGQPLPEGLATRLAAHHLAAAGAAPAAPYRVVPSREPGATAFSLFPVRGPAGGRAEAPGDRAGREGDGGGARTALSDWLLVVEADAREWPEGWLDLLAGVAELVAAERGRAEVPRAVRRRLVGEVLELVVTGAPAAEVAARLRVASPALSGAAPDGAERVCWQVVVARIDGMAGHDGDAGRAAGALLEELLAGAAPSPGSAPGSPSPDAPVAVARDDGEAVALVATPPPPAPDDASRSTGGPSGGLRAEALVDPVRAVLTSGLGDGGRLTLGVSAAVASADGLRGAWEEARHARRVAAARPGRVVGVGHEALASHVLLLPFVPDEVRRAFTSRLLDPLAAYDRRHHADLLATLTAFLAEDGSWTRCAARLHLHVNTLRYRIGRIERLTGRDLSRLEDKLDFFLALRMK